MAIGYEGYDRIIGRARRAEAKMALSSIFVAERTFFAEQSAYTACLSRIGFTPEGAKRFDAVGFRKEAAQMSTCNKNQSCLAIDFTQASPPAACQADTQGEVYWDATVAANPGSVAGTAVGDDISYSFVGTDGDTGETPAFKAGASGNIRSRSEWHDQLNINHNKIFSCQGVSGCDP